jgi:hypothetical protein
MSTMPDTNPAATAAAAPQGAPHAIDRREAIRRVGVLLGGVALVGGSSLLTACQGERPAPGAAYKATGPFTVEDIALLDEVADTILPTTARSPGAKAAATGPFMALMVAESYKARQQQVFRDGLRALEAAAQQRTGGSFLKATPEQRLALVTAFDREQKAEMDARAKRTAVASAGTRGQKEAAARDPEPQAAAAASKEGSAADRVLPDQRSENAADQGDENPAAAITEDAPPHWFRMVKELALLGYFTSEIGYTKAMRYVESPGRFDPCAAYAPGDRAWAPHA